MEQSFKKGLYTTSSQQRGSRKQLLDNRLLNNSNLFLNNLNNPGSKPSMRNESNFQKITHVETPMSEEKPRKQLKSALHQKVSEFIPSGHMSMEQLIKVVLNLQEEVRKLRKENENLAKQIQHGLQDILNLRMANQERELDALWNYQPEQFSQTNSQVQKIQDYSQLIKNILQSQRRLQNQHNQLEQNLNSDKMKIEKTSN